MHAFLGTEPNLPLLQLLPLWGGRFLVTYTAGEGDQHHEQALEVSSWFACILGPTVKTCACSAADDYARGARAQRGQAAAR